MKRTLTAIAIVLFVLSLSSCTSYQYNWQKRIDDLHCAADALFTGKRIQYYTSGQKMCEGNFKNGKRDGLWIRWYENGQKECESNWKDDELIGLHVMWYRHGQKKCEYNYKNGKRDGLSVLWYENGQKAHEENYKDGKLDGLQVYWKTSGKEAGRKRTRRLTRTGNGLSSIWSKEEVDRCVKSSEWSSGN